MKNYNSFILKFEHENILIYEKKKMQKKVVYNTELPKKAKIFSITNSYEVYNIENVVLGKK